MQRVDIKESKTSQHMEVLGLAVKSELQLQTCTPAAVDLSPSVTYVAACGNTESLTLKARPGMQQRLEGSADAEGCPGNRSSQVTTGSCPRMAGAPGMESCEGVRGGWATRADTVGDLWWLESAVAPVAAVAWVQSMAWELLHGMGKAEKKKKKEAFPLWLSG